MCEGNILTESTSSAPVGSLSLARSGDQGLVAAYSYPCISNLLRLNSHIRICCLDTYLIWIYWMICLTWLAFQSKALGFRYQFRGPLTWLQLLRYSDFTQLSQICGAPCRRMCHDQTLVKAWDCTSAVCWCGHYPGVHFLVDVIKVKALTLLLTPFSRAELSETLLITSDIPRSSLIISDIDHLSPPVK